MEESISVETNESDIKLSDECSSYAASRPSSVPQLNFGFLDTPSSSGSRAKFIQNLMKNDMVIMGGSVTKYSYRSDVKS